MIVARAWSSKTSVCEVAHLENIPPNLEEKMSRFLISPKSDPVRFEFEGDRYFMQKSKFPGQSRHFIVDLIRTTNISTADEIDQAFRTLVSESTRRLEVNRSDSSPRIALIAADFLSEILRGYDKNLIELYLSRIPLVFSEREEVLAVEHVQRVAKAGFTSKRRKESK